MHRPGDVSRDRVVDFGDVAFLAADWLKCTDVNPYADCYYSDDPVYLPGDLDRNLYVNLADFAVVAARWLSQD